MLIPMSIFDLLFLALALTAIATLVTAAIRWRKWRNAPRILRNLAICTALYIGIVYGVTAASSPKVLHIGDPECLDDWCFQVDHADRTPNGYNVAIKIFSRAKRVAQRENGAKDVYLVDEQWNRYDPEAHPTESPLNTLLQPGESVITHRTFNIPATASNIGLALDHSNDGFPICLVIGECEAFHHATIIKF
jgi:hypothetical protein